MPLFAPLKTCASIYSGSGNLFLVTTDLPTPQEVTQICQRHQLDGVVCYLPPCQMRIFNADGSEAQMCGNGLRCLIAFLWEHGYCLDTYYIQTQAGMHQGHYNQGWVRIAFPPPSSIQEKWIDGLCFYCVNTGVPHAVYLGSHKDFESLGAKYVHHPLFGKEGSNITNCVQKEDHLFVQTFERGVERITGACGTGCLAAAIVASSYFSLPSTIKILVPSLEQLQVTLLPFTLCGQVHCLSFSCLE